MRTSVKYVEGLLRLLATAESYIENILDKHFLLLVVSLSCWSPLDIRTLVFLVSSFKLSFQL